MSTEIVQANWQKFDDATSEALSFYVYCLLDSSGKPFYVGKGTGNRVFSHAHAAITEDGSGLKLERIRAIFKESGKPPEQIIIRSGLSEPEAFTVESAIIDFSELLGLSLANAQLGHYSGTLGMMTAAEAGFRYAARRLDALTDPCIIVNINRTKKRASGDDDLYEATRGDWVIGAPKRNTVKYALAEKRGRIVAVYEIDRWLPVEVTSRNGTAKLRYRFDGKIAPQHILDRYLGASIAHVKRRGASNPVRYTLKTET